MVFSISITHILAVTVIHPAINSFSACKEGALGRKMESWSYRNSSHILSIEFCRYFPSRDISDYICVLRLVDNKFTSNLFGEYRKTRRLQIEWHKSAKTVMRSNRIMPMTRTTALYLRNYRTSSAVIFTLPSEGKRISTADNAAAVILESHRSVVVHSFIPPLSIVHSIWLSSSFSPLLALYESLKICTVDAHATV